MPKQDSFRPCHSEDVLNAFAANRTDYHVFHASLLKPMKKAAQGFLALLAESCGWKRKALPSSISSRKVLSYTASALAHALAYCKASRRVGVLEAKVDEANILIDDLDKAIQR